MDYYQILGVDKKATKDEINRAFRKLAKKYHPDRNPGDKAAEKRFKDISVAHDVLSDDEKRRQYDQLREARARGFATGDFTDFSEYLRSAGARAGRGGRGAASDLSDVFASFFGDQARGPAARPQRGEDVVQRIEIPFETAVHGGTVVLHVRRPEKCPTCGGSGARPGTSATTCASCGGTGTTQSSQGYFSFSRPCPDCLGRGRRITSPCGTCGSQGRVLRDRALSVKIPRGVQDGARVRLSGEGEPGPGGGPPGDRYLEIHVRPHTSFRREGHDIHSDVELNIVQAALGTTVPVKTLSGDVRLRIPPGTSSGAKLRLRGKGAPTPGGEHGHHYVHVKIVAPKGLTAQQTELLHRFAQEARLPL
ncbi:MAG TPA: molecular chaperone DnaJ [Planctomycetota bacterium]|nr:molecular chaperone DnaJ [Planctomycetota bacterium]